MYIGASFKNKRQKIVSRQHEQLLFKEIQFNKIVQDIKLQDQLKKSNGFIAHKINIFIKGNKENSLKKAATCATLRNGSYSKNKIVNQSTYRPSMTSIIDEKEELCSKRFMKTTGQIFKKKDKNQTLHNVENNFIEQTKQQIGNQHQVDINTFSSKQELQKKFRQNFSKSLDDSMLKKKSVPKKLTSRRNNVTFLDLKVKNIQQILHKAGKNQAQNFSTLVQKDQKKITDWGWKSFYKSVEKDNQKKQGNVKEKLLRLKRTAASDHMKSEANSNPIHKIFVKQKKQISQNLNVTNSQKITKPIQKDQNPNKKSIFTSQNMFQFFNFVKGVKNFDEFSKQISLKQYRQNLQKFYVLRNSQKAIKQTQDYKNIKIANFMNHSKDQILTFVYMNENQYKLRRNIQERNS